VTAGVQPSSTTATGEAGANAKKQAGANNVALSPQEIAAQANALASTEASVQSLGFYRVPLFLLPIYKAAATQYGVPWQILAAINEIETDYGTDLSVSSAGAVGWMQFMPATWLQYGVDALNAGYADPYNPVDAIFAAARYLRAAGAANNLEAAILAYNHSQEYVSSVLLRAKLISTYPRSVIDTLTGLVDGRLPATGKSVSWVPLPLPAGSTAATGSSSATAGAQALTPAAAAAPATGSAAAGSAPSSTGVASQAITPGSQAAVSPTAAVAKAHVAKAPQRFDELTTSAAAKVVAVESGKVMQLGDSAKLGHFLVLRDVYGDVFTYAGLGSIAPTYHLPRPAAERASSRLVEVATSHDPTPSRAASAGAQAPVTLSVKKPAAKTASVAAGEAASVEAGEGQAGSKVRLFAHPGNPDARAAARLNAANRARLARESRPQPLRSGSVVTAGTVLGKVFVTTGSHEGHLRFAIRPAGDSGSVEPGAVLANWAQLQAALHPQGAKAADPLLGATASDAFLLSKADLQRAVLSDPGVTIYACGRHDVAAGRIGRSVLATLEFLSRSGLRPTVTALRCGQSPVTPSGAASAAYEGNAVEISAINGIPIAGHQGAGSISDLTIRTLLALPSEYLPRKILSLMRYPSQPTTHASSAYASHIAIEFAAPKPPVALSPSLAGAAAHSGHAAKAAAATVTIDSLSATEWEQLIGRVAALPQPTVARKPSSSAIPDPKKP
jgi:hypothetical protein